ncbi:MAG: prepilin peptidase, partial [Phycisphaerae bacterium]
MTLAVIWWLLFFTALGLSIGSFLNVVIYRLPMDESLRSPLWSACPYCRSRIAWYDNIPILSFVLLGGRCRKCDGPIGTRYLVVEAMMAILVLVLLDAFFIGQVRSGLSASQFGLSDRLAYDWPILLAHVILFACLFSMSVIDLEHYWVDIRFTNFALLCGLVLHTFWTPRHESNWVRPEAPLAVVVLFAAIGLFVTWIVVNCQPESEPESEPEDGQIPDEWASTGEPMGDVTDKRPRAPLRAPSRIAGWAAALLLIALVAALYSVESGQVSLRHAPRALIPIVLLFLFIVSESTIQRESDEEIVQAIEDERPESRRMVLAELGMLTPAIIMGLLGWWLVATFPQFAARFEGALEGRVQVPLIHHWSPLLGLSTAISGMMVAGALGWAVRIFFTLFFGKEAFG